MDLDGKKCHLTVHRLLTENEHFLQSHMATTHSDVSGAGTHQQGKSQIHSYHPSYRNLEVSAHHKFKITVASRPAADLTI